MSNKKTATSTLSASDGSKFEDLRFNNVIVYRTLRSGGTVEDCCINLAAQVEEITKRLMEIEAIAPRIVKLEDGTELIYRAPADLVRSIENNLKSNIETK